MCPKVSPTVRGTNKYQKITNVAITTEKIIKNYENIKSIKSMAVKA